MPTTPPTHADLWMLAGQSNMEGCGPLPAPEPPAEGIWSFDMLYEWQPACDPLHHLAAAVDPCHRLIVQAHGGDMAAWDAQGRLGRAGAPLAAGPGLAFAQELRRCCPGRAIALLPCAHGGTSLDEWSPERPGAPGETLYSALLKRLRACGLPPKGLLWYQGESDATPEWAGTYGERFRHLVACLRRDTGVSDLPVFTVQLARVTNWPNPPAAWETVREQQRLVADPAQRIFMTSALDGTLCDSIHLDAASQRLLGTRLAHLALHHAYGRTEFSAGLSLAEARLEIEASNPFWRLARLHLRFAGATGELRATGRPDGLGVRFDPDPGYPIDWFSVRLNADGPGTLLAELALPERADRLAALYAPGLMPHCNITDAAGQPLPALGPLWFEL